VAVGDNGLALTSPDGVTWTPATAGSRNWLIVCYGNGLFVAVSYDNMVMTSPNGSSWTEKSPGISFIPYSICFGSGRFVVTSYNRMMTSTDGKNWAEGSMPSGSWQSVCYGNGMFLAVDIIGGMIAISPAGVGDWSRISPGVPGTWCSVACGYGLFVAVAQNNRSIASQDGISWSEMVCPPGEKSWRSVAYGGGTFAAVGINDILMTAQDWGALPSRVEQLFIRDGRVFLIETDSDTLAASGVGDLANWRQDTDADSIRVDIGYKDGCDMRAVVEFAGEMIAFKAPPGRPEWGRVYRLQGKYPDWSIQLYARGGSAWNPRSVVSVPNDVLFLSKGGMMSLGTVTEYGDFKIGWAGSKVNAVLAPALSENCRMWHLPSRGQAWISDGTSCDIWVYHYQIQAWTKFAFSEKVNAVFDDGGRTYIGMGKNLYIMSGDTPCEMPASLRLRTNIKRNQSLIKGIIAGYESEAGTAARLKLGGYELALPYGGQLPDDDLSTGIVRARCNIRDWRITPEISVTGGAFSLVSLGLEVAEV
jgi:hypothetical protein